VSEWTIIFDRSIDPDSWFRGLSIEALASLVLPCRR
jgi:hypothetical protein